MAVLNKIRQRSLFLIFIIAMALFAFVLTDLFKNSDVLFGGSQDVVATVNGNNIDRVEFMNRVELMQRQMGPNSSSVQAMNNVYNQEVRKAVMESQFEDLGLSVQEAQMKDLLKQSFSSYPEFQNEAGLYDENKLTEFVSNLKAISPQRAPLGSFQINYEEWVNNEAQIAASALERMYYNMVQAGVNATLNEAEVDYMLENNTRDLTYVQIPYSSISDSLVSVTKADIKSYLDDHKDKYETDASRDIQFVEFKEVASAEDEKAIEENFQKYLNGNVEFNNGVNDTIRSFRDVQEDNIENYVNFVAGSDVNYTDTYVSKSMLPAVAADTLYKLNVGEVYGPYKDNGVYKLTKVIAEKQRPDSVKVRHILIPFAGAQSALPTVTKTNAEAKKTADSVMAVVKADRSKFPELVSELSSDQGSVSNGGEYDFHPVTQMVKPFSDFEFNNNVGDIGVVETIFGYHVIEILDQTEKTRAIKVATIARNIEPSVESIDNTFNEASKFELAVKGGNFQDEAKERDLEVKPVNGIKVLDENIPGLGRNRAIVRWAFENGTNVGDYKRFSIPGGGYAIVQLVKVNKEGLMDAENAPATVISEIRNEKKAELIREKIKASTIEDLASEQNKASLKASAVNMKNPTLSGAGSEPKVVGTAFGLKEGETSGLINGSKGVYMVRVDKVTDAASLDNYQAIANRLSNSRGAAVQNKVFNALKETADIEDNRARFY